jgi:pilus assembly protein CpaC
MHRKNRVPRGLLGGLLLLGLVGLGEEGARPVQAQPPKPDKQEAIVVPLNGVVRLSMAKRKIGDKEDLPAIKTVRAEKEGIISATISPDDPRSVTVRGVTVGATKLFLAAEGDKEPEVLDITVQVSGEEQVLGRILVSVKGQTKAHMAKRRVGDKDVFPNIRDVRIATPDLIEAKLEEVPNQVEITGRAPGITRISLFAVGETQPEVYEVVVVEGVEFLRYLIQEAVPTANVVPIRGAGNTIILTGWVAHSEDVETIMRIARSFTAGGAGGADIVNAMKVGGVMQVQLDVVVAQVSRSNLRQMSFDFLNTGERHQLAFTTGGGLIVPTGALPVFPGTDLGDVLTALPNQTAPNAFLAVFTQGQNFYNVLQALRTNGLAKLLTQPRLVTLSGHPASINDGGEQPVPQVSGLGASTGVQFLPFGTTVNFLPVVLGNGKIYLEVETTVTGLNRGIGVFVQGAFVPGRNRQYVRTAAQIEPGQSLVLGGMIQNTIQASTTKMPILGDLPFIGAAFSNKSYQENEEELIVMVTPHLVDPMDCHQLPKFLPGQETRSPDDFELFLEGLLEAPRGQRQTCPDGHYVPAYKHSPTINKYPCGNGTSCTDTRSPQRCVRGWLNGKGCGPMGGSSCGSTGCTPCPTAPAPQPTPATGPATAAGSVMFEGGPLVPQVIPAGGEMTTTGEVIVPVSAAPEMVPVGPAVPQ